MNKFSESDNSSIDSDLNSEDSIQKNKKPVKKIGGVAEESDVSDMESDIESDDENSDTDSELDELDGNDIPIPTRATESANVIDIESDDEDDDDDEDYFQKLNEDMQQNILKDHHPELSVNNYEEIESLCTIVRDENGKIVDPFHKTIPYVTRYEKARVLGERAKQLNAGATAFIEVDKNIIDGYLIALREFEAKKIPFIVQRPLPNGGCEYWHLRDLEILA
jgi:DNA-directed RNA polymerase subunit K/omega